MNKAQPHIFARSDTFLGVCEAFGEDFGFNPLLLRITIAVLLLWNPVVILSAYLAAAVFVAASRLLFPDASNARPLDIIKPAEAHNEAASEALALAA